VIQIIGNLSISGAQDTRIAKEFRIFPESTLLNNLQSIAKENRYQHLDFPETDPVQYISNHPGIERLSMPDRVDVSYPYPRLAYSRLNRRIQLSISSLKNQIQTHLRSTLLSRSMVSDMTPHACSIQPPIWTSHDALLTYDPTPGMPLNFAYPLHITLEWFILLHSKHIWSFLNALNLWLLAHRVSILQTLNFRFSRGSSHSAPANIWSNAWSWREGRC
jgi:hypothetical protein